MIRVVNPSTWQTNVNDRAHVFVEVTAEGIPPVDHVKSGQTGRSRTGGDLVVKTEGSACSPDTCRRMGGCPCEPIPLSSL
uniref:Uncharacterized protein n=1 Tax=Chromera velia CCMP2878 TaxID=1169474 RepID=A0A0G4IEJ4_9ALVE|eukprot:Cvel_13643.t1-p1 / transcript=Cvel_13643.t1 / gene=Cvel_13643 / organism=Chromera_velia_CCMP2878 / gene_product=hypothetical protein / transcript_product=hypothetical protein / location=Cvel_scaffold940:57000-58069(+) / protein_length=79 / sequence_SO=supercontig / SO=protein_coding / is_pseudo=false